MRLKSKLLVGASTLALAGATLGVAAPAAHATVTPVGNCSNAVDLIKINPALTDQTQTGVKITGNVAKDQTTKAAVNSGGQCQGAIRPGDPHVPGGPTPVLNAKSMAVSFLGNTSCANGPTAVAADATAALQWPPNGKITFTFVQTYTDLLTALAKPYKMQMDVGLLGFSSAGPDVVDIGGIVLSGVNAGANVNGAIWEDPVALTHGSTGYNTGYELDLTSAAGCADGTPNNASIAIVLSGSGSSTPSLLGSTTGGINMFFGEP